MTKENTCKINNNQISNVVLEDKWIELVNIVTKQFNYSAKVENKLLKNKIFKLIGMIPFLANSNNPSRTAVMNMSAFLIAATSGKELFIHNFSDNEYLEKRLDVINHFDGGDKNIIQKGMNLLILAMVSDYKRDLDVDRITNKYNPLSSSIWNYETIKADIIKENNSIICTEMDKILDTDGATEEPWAI
ncbi:MAG: hypothetical protein OCD02_10340 [Spirochaetaceae bacterium]